MAKKKKNKTKQNTTTGSLRHFKRYMAQRVLRKFISRSFSQIYFTKIILNEKSPELLLYHLPLLNLPSAFQKKGVPPAYIHTYHSTLPEEVKSYEVLNQQRTQNIGASVAGMNGSNEK